MIDGYREFRGRRLALAMLLGAAALPALATPLAAQARPAPVRVNIPAQPLGDALAQFKPAQPFVFAGL